MPRKEVPICLSVVTFVHIMNTMKRTKLTTAPSIWMRTIWRALCKAVTVSVRITAPEMNIRSFATKCKKSHFRLFFHIDKVYHFTQFDSPFFYPCISLTVTFFSNVAPFQRKQRQVRSKQPQLPSAYEGRDPSAAPIPSDFRCQD